MSIILDQLLRNPGAELQFSAELPSGNSIMATVGPMIGDRLATRVWFSQDYVSEQDVADATAVLEEQVGIGVTLYSNTAEGHEQAAAIMRGFMGGGQG